MSEIWRNNWLYALGRPYVDACTRNSYRRFVIRGSLPKDGAVIIAPNHTNTLMDPLVVLRSRKGGTVFASRADIFRKPKVASILRFLKMVPMARSRDRLDEIAHNREVLEEIDDVLGHDTPFCIFPEGKHRPMHSLLPMRKGIALIAIESASKRQTYIVPAGIEHSDWFHYRSDVTLTYGEPIDVNALIAAHPDLSGKDLYTVIQDELFERMSKLILYFPDDDSYEENLCRYRQEHPTRRRNRALSIALAAILSPLFLLSAVLTLPMWATAEYICSKKIKDHAFDNTARYGAKLAGTPLMLLLWGLLLGFLCPWWISVPVVCWVFHSYSFFYDWLNLVRCQD